MFKKIVLFALLLIPVMGYAQEQKIAYCRSDEVFQAMPEYTQAMDSLEKSRVAILTDLQVMQDQLDKEKAAFDAQQATMNESVRATKRKMLDQLSERIDMYQQTGGQQLQTLRNSLLAPIQAKLMKAIEAVGTENRFSYIADASVMLYTSASSPDATPMVKAKLGLK